MKPLNECLATVTHGVYVIDLYRFGLICREPSVFCGIRPQVSGGRLVDALLRPWPPYDDVGSRTLAAKVIEARLGDGGKDSLNQAESDAILTSLREKSARPALRPRRITPQN